MPGIGAPRRRRRRVAMPSRLQRRGLFRCADRAGDRREPVAIAPHDSASACSRGRRRTGSRRALPTRRRSVGRRAAIRARTSGSVSRRRRSPRKRAIARCGQQPRQRPHRHRPHQRRGDRRAGARPRRASPGRPNCRCAISTLRTKRSRPVRLTGVPAKRARKAASSSRASSASGGAARSSRCTQPRLAAGLRRTCSTGRRRGSRRSRRCGCRWPARNSRGMWPLCSMVR